jgi:hypothetical protein
VYYYVIILRLFGRVDIKLGGGEVQGGDVGHRATFCWGADPLTTCCGVQTVLK